MSKIGCKSVKRNFDIFHARRPAGIYERRWTPNTHTTTTTTTTTTTHPHAHTTTVTQPPCARGRTHLHRQARARARTHACTLAVTRTEACDYAPHLALVAAPYDDGRAKLALPVMRRLLLAACLLCVGLGPLAVSGRDREPPGGATELPGPDAGASAGFAAGARAGSPADPDHTQMHHSNPGLREWRDILKGASFRVTGAGVHCRSLSNISDHIRPCPQARCSTLRLRKRRP
jgi:hypothetical protein